MHWLSQSNGDLLEIAAELLRLGARCPGCNCHGPFVGVGEFIPWNQRQAGAPVGKVRMAWYLLCAHCVCDPEAPARIDAAMMADLGRMADSN